MKISTIVVSGLVLLSLPAFADIVMPPPENAPKPPARKKPKKPSTAETPTENPNPPKIGKVREPAPAPDSDPPKPPRKNRGIERRPDDSKAPEGAGSKASYGDPPSP